MHLKIDKKKRSTAISEIETNVNVADESITENQVMGQLKS